jgi:CO/xanthine dehydrogenase Mo-binding subunit
MFGFKNTSRDEQPGSVQLTRRQLLKTGGMIMVSAAATGPLAILAGTGPVLHPPTPAQGPYPVPAGTLVDSFIAISADGDVIGFNGHVDLGTGVRTAIGQLVADEIETDIARVKIILGHTTRTPDLGPTIASDTIQNTSTPMRQAARQVRQLLINLASERWSVPAAQLRTENGFVIGAGKRLSYGELAAGQDLHIDLDQHMPLRSSKEHKYIGQSVQRVDIPNKVLGALTYVHDVRLPGMLHGRVVRPPYAGADHTAPLGDSLISVDQDSIKHLPGIVKLVVLGDFVGIVAEREEQAIAAMHQLKVQWKEWAGLPDLSQEGLRASLNQLEKAPRMLREDDNFKEAIQKVTQPLEREYVWPYHMHASIGPSCAVARFADGKAEVWSGTQNPHDLRKDLGKLIDLHADYVNVHRMEASGCYGRNCADDVAADALLLARAVGKPVRVQLMREQESGWEPKGTGQLIKLRGGLDDAGNVLAYELQTSYPSNLSPTLALVLTGKVKNEKKVLQMGDRTSIPLYDYPAVRAVSLDAAPMVRASWMRGVSALPNVLAHECWIDEAAYLAKADPIAYRLRYMSDERAVGVMKAAHRLSQWQDGVAFRAPTPADQKIAKGRGFAYARYFHSKFPGFGAAWAAWVCDVSVNRETGEVKVDKVFCTHDCGAMVNPAGVRHQVHGNIIQSTSRALKEFVTFDASGTTSLDWGGYPLLRFDELPQVEIELLELPHEAPMGAGESASVPSAAAIANAIFDATGVRLTEVPFTPSRVLAALRQAQARK